MKQRISRLGCLALGLTAGLFADPARQPNIVYILADDLGYADAGFMGNQVIKTPNLDRLAAEGTVLNCLYGQSLCSPTRAALMTGRYPVSTGIYRVIFPRAPWGLSLEERTMGDALREAGYETAMVGKWHLGEFEEAYLPTRRGFEHQYGTWFGMVDYFTHMRGTFLDWHRDDLRSEDEGYATQLVADEACRLIRERRAEQPLFLYLAFNAVHEPFQAPAEYEAAYQQLEGDQRTYAAMVSAMDVAIGQVVAALDQAGMRENTLIIFSSDNGGHLPGKIADNTPLRSGKGTIYEGGVRLSAFVNWPGRVPAGRHVDEPMHVVDWLPTLTTLAGVSPTPALPLDGKDIWRVITAGARSPHDAIPLSGPTNVLPGAIRVGDYKLLIGASDTAKGQQAAASLRPDEMKVELYNVVTDIGEQQDLAASQPGKVAELRARFDDYAARAVEPTEVRFARAAQSAASR